MLQIGNIQIQQTAALAPMASVADWAYRSLCKEYGACYLVGELVSAKGLCYSDRKAAELLRVREQERPMAVQLFGCDPDFIARAVKIALSYHPDIIDLNMGCPVPKVVSAGSGSALMKNPALAGEIVRAAVAASSVPVTVKFRKGWDEQHVNAVEFAKRMEDCGAAALTVHGRTRSQMYGGEADWDCIAEVKQAVSVPVIANGDVVSPETARALYDHTGADLIMVGRGSYGRPWLFRQIADYLSTGSYQPDPPVERRMQIMVEHVRRICADKGEYIGMKQARAQAAHYLKGVHGAARLRARCGSLEHFPDIVQLAQEVARSAGR